MGMKRYKSLFENKTSKQENKKNSKLTLKLKEALKESIAPAVIDSVVDKIESVITDVIDDHGVDNAVVDSLSNTVKTLNAQNSIVDEIGMLESKVSAKYKSLFEAEETVADKKEDDKKDDKKDDAEMKEKARLKRVKEMAAKLENRTQISEEEDEEKDEKDDKEDMEESDDSDEDDMEEAITGMKSNTYKSIFDEESETDEGDSLISDDTGSDYDAMSLDNMGNAPSDRGMDADDDENASGDGA